MSFARTSMMRIPLALRAMTALAPLCLVSLTPGAEPSILEGITFWAQPAEIFVPLDEVLAELHWKAQWDEEDGTCVLNDIGLTDLAIRHLTDGTELISLFGLRTAGATVETSPVDSAWTVLHRRRQLIIRAGLKNVHINLKTQMLEAWQGSRMVLKTRISSGRRGSTPVGEYKAGPFRARMHHSKRYHNAPMPWSVQVNGHIFIHGFSEVPPYPASHGCIRLPLDEGNPAKFFFEWVDDGTPVSVRRG